MDSALWGIPTCSRRHTRTIRRGRTILVLVTHLSLLRHRCMRLDTTEDPTEDPTEDLKEDPIEDLKEDPIEDMPRGEIIRRNAAFADLLLPIMNIILLHIQKPSTQECGLLPK